MNTATLWFATAIAAASLMSACTKKQDNVMERAVDQTKDALDMRDHEKLKDAAEDAGDAMKNAGEGIKDAAQDAAAEVKEAVPDRK